MCLIERKARSSHEDERLGIRGELNNPQIIQNVPIAALVMGSPGTVVARQRMTSPQQQSSASLS